MRKFAVSYSTTTVFEAVVKAKSKKEAEEKVVEVIGEPIKVESVHEIVA